MPVTSKLQSRFTLVQQLCSPWWSMFEPFEAGSGTVGEYSAQFADIKNCWLIIFSASTL